VKVVVCWKTGNVAMRSSPGIERSTEEAREGAMDFSTSILESSILISPTEERKEREPCTFGWWAKTGIWPLPIETFHDCSFPEAPTITLGRGLKPSGFTTLQYKALYFMRASWASPKKRKNRKPQTIGKYALMRRLKRMTGLCSHVTRGCCAHRWKNSWMLCQLM